MLPQKEANTYLAGDNRQDYFPDHSALQGDSTLRFLLSMRQGYHRRRLDCGAEGHFWHKTSFLGTGYCEECPSAEGSGNTLGREARFFRWSVPRAGPRALATEPEAALRRSPVSSRAPHRLL